MESRSCFRGVAPMVLVSGAAQLGNLYREASDDEAAAALDAAWDAGACVSTARSITSSACSCNRSVRVSPDDRVASTCCLPKVGAGCSVRARGRRTEWTTKDSPCRRGIAADLTSYVMRCCGPSKESRGAAVNRLPRHRLSARPGRPLGIDDRRRCARRTPRPGRRDGRRCGDERCQGDHRVRHEDRRRRDRRPILVARPVRLGDLLLAAEERGVAVVDAGSYNCGLLSRDRVADGAKYDYQDAPPALIERARRIAAVCEADGTTLPVAATHFRFATCGSHAWWSAR